MAGDFGLRRVIYDLRAPIGVPRWLVRRCSKSKIVNLRISDVSGGFGGSGPDRAFRATEGHAEQAQEIAGLVVRVGAGDDGDVDTDVLLHIVDRDFGEDVWSVTPMV